MNAFTQIATPQPAPLGKPYNPSYFDVELDPSDLIPEVLAFFGDPTPTRDMVSGAFSGMATELVGLRIGGLQLSRDQAAAMTGESHVRQLEELHAEGAL